jgi:hypothetical protein
MKERFCLCGCGQIITAKDPRTKYIKGHYGAKHYIPVEKVCQCGCGKKFISKDPNTRFIRGHKDKELADRIQAKAKESTLKKYGVDNVFKLKEMQDLCKQRIKEKYGVDNINQLDYIKEKRKNTCILKYGTENPTQSDVIKEKSIQTCINKYGVTNVSKVEEFKTKRTNTFLDRYNCTCAAKHEVFKDKMINTQIQKYGMPFLATKEIKEHTSKLKREQIFNILQNNTDYEILFPKEIFIKYGFIGHGYDVIEDNEYCHRLNGQWLYYKVKCRNCGHILYISFSRLQKFHCVNCQPVGRSLEEQCVEKFIQSLNIETQHSVRNILSGGKELDIYIPSKNIAIEFNGLYWHSIIYIKDPMYHLQKTKECQEKGIQLIHIMEDEWVNKPEITKSRIKNLLGLWENTVYARKCIIKEIKEPSVYMKFLNENHIQGAVGCKHAIGLYYNDELISLMTFGALRKALGSTNKENEYELLRFCNKLNYHIPGGASKLFKYFINTYKPDKIISYADRRWSSGNLYYKLGFNLHHSSLPNYWYIDPMYSYREYRFKYRKSELPKLLEHFDPEISEQQNMLDNGFNIIYDCGNMVFEWITK